MFIASYVHPSVEDDIERVASPSTLPAIDYALLDNDLIVERHVFRLLNIGSWLTSIDRRFPLRVSFPTDALVS